MAQISDRVNRLAASATFAMLQKSNELSAQGVDVVNMSVGEPDFNTPDYVKKAAVEAVEQNYSKYSPVPGYMWLRKACSDKLKRENNLDYAPTEILVSTGAKQSLCNVIMAIINPGDEVLLPSPCWVSYPEMVKLAGGIPVVIKAGIDQDFKVTAAQVEAAITPKTKAIMICSPSNPTGSVYTGQELESIAKVLNKYPDVFIVSDEIYELYSEWMDESFPDEYKREKRGLTRDLRSRYISCEQDPEKGKVDGRFVRVIRGIRLK